MELPDINKRVGQIIDFYADGKRKKFADTIGIPQQTINRLFNIDSRTEKYPLVTTEVLQKITEMYVSIDCQWLLTGKGSMQRRGEDYQMPGTTLEAAEPPLQYGNSAREQGLLDIIKEQSYTIRKQADTIAALSGDMGKDTGVYIPGVRPPGVR